MALQVIGATQLLSCAAIMALLEHFPPYLFLERIPNHIAAVEAQLLYYEAPVALLSV